MQGCRVFPSTINAWRSVLHTALAAPSSKIKSPPHFQAYCIDPRSNSVIENMNYSSMLTFTGGSPKRKSGVLCLLEPVTFSGGSGHSDDNNNNNNNKSNHFLNDCCHPFSTDAMDAVQREGAISSHLPFELRCYVTLRHGRMRTHKGEVSFPGGRVDGHETPEQAAMREGFEEIGADPSTYQVQGPLSRVYSFPSSSFVVPSVALSNKEANDSICVRHTETATKIRLAKESKARRANQKWHPHIVPPDRSGSSELQVDFAEVNKASTLNLRICSETEVDAIESIDILRLLLDTEGHKFVDRSWTSVETKMEQRWLLPAFDTAENSEILWGLTAFVFCELLCRLAFALQQLPLPENATKLEKEVHDRVMTFCERSSEFYVQAKDPHGPLRVTGLPAENQCVPFHNPYDDITESSAEDVSEKL